MRIAARSGSSAAFSSFLAVAAAFAFVSSAAAQDVLPPLPGADPAAVPPPPPGPPPGPPPPGESVLASPAPRAVAPSRKPRGKHAPRLSLWSGARLGVLGFGGGFYGVTAGNPPASTTEWTTQIVKPGATLEADVGVRLGRRFIPYVFYERAVLGVGARFEGDTGASAYSELYGGGIRFTAGNVDTAGFLTEISIGQRTVGVNANGQSYRMSGFEYFKLGLGAEIRISSLLVLSPLASLSTGTLTGTSGAVDFSAKGSALDGITHPPYENGATIQDQRGYVMLSITCGAHFDLLGD